MSKQDLLKPTNDYVFGRIFGYKGNEIITQGLLEAITEDKYQSLEIASSVPTLKELQDDKVGILDLKVTADNNTNFDIEMQVASCDYMADRILWYWSNLYYNSINKGQEYIKTKKTIAILIADFNLKNLAKIHNYHTSWHIREDAFSEIILTEKLEIHIIELKKLEVNNNQKGKNRELENWLKFILNPEEMEEIDMSEDIKAAKRVLEQISKDENEREKAYLRDKYIRDWNSRVNEGYDYGKAAGMIEGRAEGIKEGRKEGIKEGRKEGITEGRLQEKYEIAKKMLKEKITIECIMDVTGLTKEEIEKLKNNSHKKGCKR